MVPDPSSAAAPKAAFPFRFVRPAAALAAWSALVFILSVAPIPAAPPLPVKFISPDTLAHILFYVPLGALFYWSFPRGPRGLAGLRAALAAFAFGAGLEVVQAFLPYRSFEWSDGLADLIGGATGAVIGLCLPRFAAGPPVKRDG